MVVRTVGLVGAGGIAPVHAQAWQDLGLDVLVYSLDGAEQLARRYDFEVAADLDELFRRADLVDIVTPSLSHRAIAVAALEAGRAVVCEKPLGPTSADAAAIAAAALEAGVPVFPAHVVRYFPDYHRVNVELSAGRIGRPAIARWWRHGEAPPAGSWFHTEASGGGIVRDLMIHDLDQALWNLGDVVEVFGVQSQATQPGDPSAVAHAVLTHANGAISQVTASWGPRGTAFRTGFSVFGTEGMLEHDSGNDGLFSRDVPGSSADSGYLPPQTRAESPYTSELSAFLDVIEGRATCARVGAHDGVAAVALAEAVMRSIRERHPVRVELPQQSESENRERA